MHSKLNVDNEDSGNFSLSNRRCINALGKFEQHIHQTVVLTGLHKYSSFSKSGQKCW